MGPEIEVAAVLPGFTKRYGLTMLVYSEPHASITSAIQR